MPKQKEKKLTPKAAVITLQETGRSKEAGLKKKSSVSFQALRRVANACHVARLCINTLKHQVSKTKWTIVPADGVDVLDEVEADFLKTLLSHPNEQDTFRTLMDRFLEDILVLDAGALELVGDEEAAEIWHVDGATVRPFYDEHGKFGNPAYGQFIKNKGDVAVAEWSLEEMVYLMQNPQSDTEKFGYGMSPLEAALMVATNILNADNFMGTFFEVGTLPPVLINLGKDINPDELDSFKEFWKAEVEGKPWKTAFFSGTDQIQVERLTNGSPNDMQFSNYQQWLMKLMCAAYEVSPQDIGFTQEQGLNRATAEVQQEISRNRGLANLLDLLKESINDRIVYRWLGLRRVQFTWVGIDNKDETEATNNGTRQIAVGAKAINEFREDIGLDPIPGFDVPFLMTPNGPWFLDKPFPQAQQAPVSPEAPGSPETASNPEGEEISNIPKDPEAEAPGASVEKSVFRGDYICRVDDRGQGQPFIWTTKDGKFGYVIKPPVAVAINAMETEQRVTHQMAAASLNVTPVTIMSKPDLSSCLPGETFIEFDDYCRMTPAYDSEKWKAKHGHSREYDRYVVSLFIPGRALNDPSLIADMKRRPADFEQAARDLAALVAYEAQHVLGDRRADQYIVTPGFRAWGFDYQFEGDIDRWSKTKDAVTKVLGEIPSLLSVFQEELNSRQQRVQKFNENHDESGKFASDGDTLYHYSDTKISGLESRGGTWLTNNNVGYSRKQGAEFRSGYKVDLKSMKLASKKESTKLGLYDGDQKKFAENLKAAGYDGAKFLEDGDTHVFILDESKAEHVDSVEKFNSSHDENGRFAEGDGSAVSVKDAVSELKSGLIGSKFGGYGNINRLLRNDSPLRSDEKAMIDKINEVAKGAKLDKDITLYRGLKETQYGTKFTQLKVGDVIRDKGFSCATEVKGVALGHFVSPLNSGDKGVMLVIDAKAGDSIGRFRDFIGEREGDNEKDYFFPKDSSFTVTSKTFTRDEDLNRVEVFHVNVGSTEKGRQVIVEIEDDNEFPEEKELPFTDKSTVEGWQAKADGELRSRGEKAGVDFSVVSLEEFRAGLEDEQEHGYVVDGDEDKLAMIAADHLKEDSQYYTKLRAAGLEKFDPDQERDDSGKWSNGSLHAQAATFANMGKMQQKWPAVQPVKTSTLKRFRDKEMFPDKMDSRYDLHVSLAAHGFTEPLVVAAKDGDKPFLLDGHHRLAEAEKLGITQIPVVVQRGMQYYTPDIIDWKAGRIDWSMAGTELPAITKFNESHTPVEKSRNEVWKAAWKVAEPAQESFLASLKKQSKELKPMVNQVISDTLTTKKARVPASVVAKAAGADAGKAAFKGALKAGYEDAFLSGVEIVAAAVAKKTGKTVEEVKTVITGDKVAKAIERSGLYSKLKERGTGMITSVAASKQKQLERFIEDKADQGEEIDDIADEALDEFDTPLKDWEMERIARTETAWAVNQGVKESTRELGIDSFTVLLDPDACQECLDAYSGGEKGDVVGDHRYGAESAAMSGDDVEEPPIHVNCRCLLQPDMNGAEDAIAAMF